MSCRIRILISKRRYEATVSGEKGNGDPFSHSFSLKTEPQARPFIDLPSDAVGQLRMKLVSEKPEERGKEKEYSISIATLRSTPNRCRVYKAKGTKGFKSNNAAALRIESYFREKSSARELVLKSVGASDVSDAAVASSPQVPPQLPPPNTPSLVPPMVAIGGALAERTFERNGPLPPPDGSSAEVEERWGGYKFSPLPQQSRVADSGDGTASHQPPPVRNWVNKGKEGYIKNWGAPQYEEKEKSQFVPIPPPSPERFIALEIGTLLLALGFAATSAQTGKRGTHAYGVGIGGDFSVSSSLPVGLENSFFEPEKQYNVVIRHSTLHSKDDAGMDARGCAISFREPGSSKPLFDIPMNSGEICLFWSVATVAEFARYLGSGNLKEYVGLYPAAYEALVDTMRRAPPSFSQLSYSSKITFDYENNKGKKFLARFRIVPLVRAGGSFSGDPGMPDDWDMNNIWNFDRKPDEMRAPDYLREEYKARFAGATLDQDGSLVTKENDPVAQYSFEIQSLPWEERFVKEREVYNLAKPWDLPWQQVGVIDIKQLLSDFACEMVRFSLSNMPPSGDISLPQAWCPVNYSSVAVARVKAYPVAGAVRSGAAPRWEPFSTVTQPFLSSAGGPWVTTASAGYSTVGGALPPQDKNVPPTLTAPGFALIPAEARYTSAETVALLTSRLNFYQNFLKSLVSATSHLETGRGGGLYYGGGEINNFAPPGQPSGPPSSSVRAKLVSAYSRFGDISPPEGSLAPPSYGIFNFELSELQKMVCRTFEHWLIDDYEFARARLGALNPVLIRSFGKSEDDILLLNSASDFSTKNGEGRIAGWLKEAHENSRLFVCDYRALEDFQGFLIEGRYLAAPYVFFDIETKQPSPGDEGAPVQVLRPIAITLDAQTTTWFFPPLVASEADPGYYGWLLAKMHVATADTLFHEFGPHLTICHMVSETFMIAMYQCFPRSHPLFQLMKPHFEGLATINFLGIAALLEAGNIVDQIMSGGRVGAIRMMANRFNNWTLMGSVPLEADLNARGVTEKELPVSYPFRDDGLKFYNVLQNFISEYLEATYENDESVAKDEALQSWWGNLSNPNPPPTQGWASLNQNCPEGHSRVPLKAPQTIAELSDILSSVLWNASAQHAAVNNGQFAFCGFVPNAPMLQRAPVPQSQVEVTEDTILDSLPALQEAVQQIGFMSILTTDLLITADTFVKTILTPDEDAERLRSLYGFDEGSPQGDLVNRFSGALRDLDDGIKNAQRERVVNYRRAFGPNPVIPLTVEYPFLQPSLANLSINN